MFFGISTNSFLGGICFLEMLCTEFLCCSVLQYLLVPKVMMGEMYTSLMIHMLGSYSSTAATGKQLGQPLLGPNGDTVVLVLIAVGAAKHKAFAYTSYST